MKWRDQFARFLVSGVANTLIGYLLYLAATQVLDYRWAYAVSYVLGVGISYVINSTFVFRQPMSWRKLLAFPAVYVVQFLAGLALLWLFVSRLHVPARFGPLLVIPVTIPLTFVISRFILIPRNADEHRPL